MPGYDAVLFDVDGTLIDSAPGIFHTLEQTFRVMGVDISGKNLNRYLGPPLRRTFSEYFSSEEQIERATALYRQLYAQVGSRECALYPGVAEMLARLQAAGVRLYTAPSKPGGVVTPMLARLQIAGRFTYIGGASFDRTRDTKTAVMQDVLARPELQGARVLMAGDRRDDLEGAADCGIPAAGVLYGYGSREELEPFAPAVLVQSCEELTDYILNER